MKRFVVLDKKVGETPLQCAETWREAQPPAYASIPLAYAGRLDPMASGKLLVLIGDECKRQEQYHGLDKGYDFSVLFGVSSDTADVLGRLQFGENPVIDPVALRAALHSLVGEITLPYPHFSAKTVQGKPLHVWTLEDRLDEIEIPTQTSTIYQLKLKQLYTKTRAEIADAARAKIDTIPLVTDERKALGNDFRRVDVRADWEEFKVAGNSDDQFCIADLHCIASSGTYMRSLAEEITKHLNTIGLAYAIHRTNIGRYKKGTCYGLWIRQYR